MNPCKMSQLEMDFNREGSFSYERSDIQLSVESIAEYCKSPYTDGWTARSCKKELFLLRCYLEDVYAKLPKFVDEQAWEQERLMEILKR